MGVGKMSTMSLCLAPSVVTAVPFRPANLNCRASSTGASCAVQHGGHVFTLPQLIGLTRPLHVTLLLEATYPDGTRLMVSVIGQYSAGLQ